MGNCIKFVPILIILWCGYALAVTCPAGQWVNGINPQACSTPVASGSGTYPSGSPPQITGYSAANTPEAESVSGSCGFSRTGANAYLCSVVGPGGNLLVNSAVSNDLSGFDGVNALGLTPPIYYDDTGGSGNAFGLLYSQGPSTNVAFTAQGAVGSIVIGNGASAPVFANSPIMWSGTGNAVVPSTTAPSVWAIQGSSTPVATTSEGTVSELTYGVGTAGGGSASLGGFTCGMYTAAGVLTTPQPTGLTGNNYVAALRDNLATTTTTCTITGAVLCTSNVLHSIANGHQFDYIVTPASSNAGCTAAGTPAACCTGNGTGTCTPVALIPKCYIRIY